MYLLDLKQPSCKHSWAVPGCFAMLDFKFSSVALQRFSSRLPRPYQLIFFSSTIRGKFCGIHPLLFARPFVTAVLSLCSVVAVISKHSRTVFKYNHALVLRVQSNFCLQTRVTGYHEKVRAMLCPRLT